MNKEGIAWWEGKRPVGWSEAQHLENPTINCIGEEEKQLAKVIAKLINLEGYKQEKIDRIKELVIRIEGWAFLCGVIKEVYRPELEKAWQELNKYLEENI